jgi:hypothetical protein
MMSGRAFRVFRVLRRLSPVFLAAVLLAGQPGGVDRVRVLDDFESPRSAARWRGGLEWSRQYASHGSAAALIRFDGRQSEIGTAGVPRDWRSYDRLLFDIYCGRKVISSLTLRIYDAPEMKPGPKTARGYYEAHEKIFIQNGWNHAEIRLAKLRAASYDRDLRMDRISGISLLAGRAELPLTLYLDNLRLVAGEEPRLSASRVRPQDTVTVVDGRFFTVRQVARPEDVPEAAEVTALRRICWRSPSGRRGPRESRPSTPSGAWSRRTWGCACVRGWPGLITMNPSAPCSRTWRAFAASRAANWKTKYKAPNGCPRSTTPKSASP